MNIIYRLYRSYQYWYARNIIGYTWELDADGDVYLRQWR